MRRKRFSQSPSWTRSSWYHDRIFTALQPSWNGGTVDLETLRGIYREVTKDDVLTDATRTILHSHICEVVERLKEGR